MNCPTCQHDNVDNARFCAKCGTLLPTQAEEEVDRLLGQTVGGRYRIVKLLGEGGMGRVYEAERSMAGVVQRIAIKTLHQHLSSDAQVVARFNRECATLVGLKHPNTIRVEDFGQTDDGTLYIAMEFVDGVNVGQELERRGAMPPERVERIMEQICGSLAEAHKTGIVHRDLKPDNIVLMNVGEDIDVVKVLDFGIAARKESADAKKEAKLTQQGMVLGTPPYMSPEQFMGKELDPRSDIYSLGVMAYEMLTGKLPFDANTPWEWATKHMTAQPFPFEDMPTTTDIPGKMKHAIMRALSKNTSERQDNVKLFFEELRSGKIDNSLRPSLVSVPNSGTGTQLGLPT
ncbi:MAG: serine/threonine protein kinase, partial [Myxococcales bacterium]